MFKKISKKKMVFIILPLSLLFLFIIWCVWWDFFSDIWIPPISRFGTTLSDDQEIQRIKLPKGSSAFSYNIGRLEHVKLSQDWEIRGKKCYAGDRISFGIRGNITEIARELEEDTIIQGIPCTSKGSSGGIFLVGFYESGRLMGARLSQDQEIQRIQFPQGTYISFYESGRVKEAWLVSLDCLIQGIKYSGGTNIYFDESGKITGVKEYRKK